MKYVISNSQLTDVLLKERIDEVRKILIKHLYEFSPCDYMPDVEEENDDFVDYFSEVISSMMGDIIKDLKLSMPKDTEEYESVYIGITDSIFDIFYDEVKEDFDDHIENLC